VPPRRRGRALATVVGGASLATAFGVPLGTLASAIAGWRAVFFAVAAVTALAAVAARLSPAVAPARPPPPARAAAPRGRLVAILTVTLLWATGSFTFFTYIGAVLRETASVSTAGLAGVLLVFGTAGLAGTAASGWLTDRRGPLLALCGSLALTALALAGMGLTAAVPGHSALAASIAAIAGYGLGTWAATPPQQHRLLGSGGDARLLLSVNASALYLGVALGGAAGGIILAVSHSVSAVCWAAAGLELAALAVAAGSNRATERARRGAA
jgi:predicted MFS family arabinose efflux permease